MAKAFGMAWMSCSGYGLHCSYFGMGGDLDFGEGWSQEGCFC